MMRFWMILLVMWGGLSAALFSQPAFIPVNVDINRFQMNDSLVHVEVAISFYEKSLLYTRVDSAFVGRFQAEIVVLGDQDTVYSESREFSNAIRDLATVNQANELRHVFFLRLAEGDYHVVARVIDLTNGARGGTDRPLQIIPFSGEDLVLSDIQLAAVIRKATGQSSFDKNGLNVLPNPSNVFSITLPMLYYYAEVYNLGPAGDGADYLVESWISDADGNVVRTFPAKKAAKSGRTGVVVGGNNIITLPSAIYKFNLQVVDGERRARQSCTFQLFKPDKNAEIAEAANAAREGANLLRGYYMTLSDEQFEEELEQVLSVARREEKEVAAALANRSEKTTFLVDFWQRHDPDPATANNEYRQQFQELVQLANVTFENRFRPGWKTERGRVLLTYGRPDEIVKTPVQRQGKPYETWTYNNLENGSIFIFADLRGFGQYELIHSTYSQELNNPNWENTLKEVRLNSGENDDVFR